MAVFLFPNRMKDTDLAVTRHAAQQLRSLSVPVISVTGNERELGGLGVTFLTEAEAFTAADHVVTVGGDGTLLRAAPSCVRANKPVLGINLGRTGFLATCEVEEMPEKLSLLARGDYRLAQRSLLQAAAPGCGWQGLALNDVAIFGTSRLHPMDYAVFCDGMPVSRFRSDGLIIATPTGSTAYSFSAGGPILDAEVQAMVLTPVCAHGMRTAPLVFSAGRRLCIQAEAENRTDVSACTDSQNSCILPPGARVEVEVAKQTLQLIVFSQAEQFRAIENKLMRR